MSFHEEPQTLNEQMAWAEVLSAERPDLEKPVSKNFRATKEPFLTLESDGWEKRHYARRFADGTCIVIHFWESGKQRDYLKVVE